MLSLLSSSLSGRHTSLLALVAFLWAAPAFAQATCETGTQTSGALYEICVPETGPAETLVLYAHGFVFPQQPLTVPAFDSSFLTAQGFAYASTSYYANGLVVPELAIDDLTELIDLYAEENGQPERVLLIGFSNGSLVSTLALERFPETFAGALASCGPIGSYAREFDYLGDIFVVFEYFFPDALDSLFGIEAGGPDGINPAFFAALVQAATQAGVTPDNFLAGYLSGILGDPANATQTGQLLGVIAATPEIAATFDGPVEGSTAVITAALFTVFAVNDAIAVLGGEAYDNTTRVYVSPFGPVFDAALNAGVARYAADPAARLELETEFETTGDLQDPLIALHTTRDVLVPIWHEALYGDKVSTPSLFDPRPIERFGHCAFTPEEIAGSFAELAAITQGNTCAYSFGVVAPPSTDVPSEGGRLRLRFGIDNSSNDAAATVDIWATVQDSEGNVVFVRNPRTPSVAAGAVYSAGYDQRVPASIPDGTYTFTLYAGTFNADNPAMSETCGSASFVITKGDAVGKADTPAALRASDWADAEIVNESVTPAALRLASGDEVRIAPNPTRGQTTFAFTLSADAEVSLAVYDVRGREVAQVVDGPMAAGAQTVTFAQELPAGVYLWRLATGEGVQTGRLTVVAVAPEAASASLRPPPASGGGRFRASRRARGCGGGLARGLWRDAQATGCAPTAR